MLKISHSVGHALTTPGKQSPDGVKEWQQASAVCKLVIAELSNYEGIAQKRFDDITGRVDYPLKQRYSAINDWGAHVHIDYHLNAYGVDWNDARGVEVFIAESKPKEALALAQKLQSNLVSSTGFKDRGVKFEDFAMVRYTKCTSVLIEMGFMTNRQNADFIRSAEGQKKIAMAIVKALAEQYGLRKVYDTVKLFSFFTGGYSGQALTEVHDYVKVNKWDFTTDKNATGDIVFTVGVFGEGTEAAIRFEEFLQHRGYAYQKKYA